MREIIISFCILFAALSLQAQSVNGIRIDGGNTPILVYLGGNQICLPTTTCFIANLNPGHYTVEVFATRFTRAGERVWKGEKLYKDLVYFDGNFPFIHQNWISINLGTSYPTYSGQGVLEVVTSSQGEKVKKEVMMPNGQVKESSTNFYTCKYKETLDNMDQKNFTDHYADCETLKSDPSMMQISFTMGIISLLLTYVIGLPLGIQMANHKGKWVDKLGQWYIVFMNAIPGLAYIVLVRFIGGKYFGLPSMFPMLGASHPKSYILPIISLTLGSVAGRMMWMRRYMIDQSTMDYVKFARAKGLSENEIFYKHIFRNAIGPIAHGLPAAVILCISGALITEGVYSIPGMGKILPDSISIYNNSMVIGLTFIFTSLSILSTFLGDWLLTLVDPRISLDEKGGSR